MTSSMIHEWVVKKNAEWQLIAIELDHYILQSHLLLAKIRNSVSMLFEIFHQEMCKYNPLPMPMTILFDLRSYFIIDMYIGSYGITWIGSRQFWIKSKS